MVDGFRDFPKLANKFAVTNELCRASTDRAHLDLKEETRQDVHHDSRAGSCFLSNSNVSRLLFFSLSLLCLSIDHSTFSLPLSLSLSPYQVGFAVVFYAVRVIAWVPVSIGFWRDAFRLLSGEVPMHTMPKYIVCFWLFVHLGLTLLQWHWGIIIAKGAYYMAIGDTSARENEAKGA